MVMDQPESIQLDNDEFLIRFSPFIGVYHFSAVALCRPEKDVLIQFGAKLIQARAGVHDRIGDSQVGIERNPPFAEFHFLLLFPESVGSRWGHAVTRNKRIKIINGRQITFPRKVKQRTPQRTFSNPFNDVILHRVPPQASTEVLF
jgi:hypothetical protein